VNTSRFRCLRSDLNSISLSDYSSLDQISGKKSNFHNCDYAVFKKGTKPDWEDRNNSLGGRWIIERTKTENIDRLWLESLFILIGEHLPSPLSDQINGALIQKKRGKFKLAFWLKDSCWERELIGKELRTRLNITGSDSMEFRVHKEEQKQRQVGWQPHPGKYGPNVSFRN